MKALRIYYDTKGYVTWTSSLDGPGEFPVSASDELATMPRGTKVIAIDDEAEITSFNAATGNRVVDGKLVIGTPYEPAPVVTPRDLAAEVDDIKTRLSSLEVTK